MYASSQIAVIYLTLLVCGVAAINMPTEGEPKAQLAHQYIMENLEYGGCVEYCNGQMVVDLDAECVGVYEFSCKLAHIEVSDQCLGFYNRTVEEEEVEVYCSGLFFSYYEEHYSWGSYQLGSQCGGDIDISFKGNPLDPSYMNIVCEGTTGEMRGPGGSEMQMSSTATLLNIRELAMVKTSIANEAGPSHFHCSLSCNGGPMVTEYCDGEFQVHCVGDPTLGTFFYVCDGLFLGGWTKNACIGYSAHIQFEATSTVTKTCSEVLGYKQDRDGTIGDACQGVHTTTIEKTSPTKVQVDTVNVM